MLARLSALRYEIAHAIRALLARPGYALAAILTLALGLGATTAVFSALNGYLLRPLPYPDGERLMSVYGRIPSFGDFKLGISIGDYLDVRENVEGIDAIGLWKREAAALSREGTADRRTQVGSVTPSLLAMLGTRPALGRALVEEDALPGAAPVVVLSHRLWTELYGANPDAIGQKLRIGREDVEVVGVFDAGVVLPDPGIEAVRSFVVDPAKRGEARGDWRGNAIVRVPPGTTAAALEARLRDQWKAFVVANPEMKFFVDDMGYRIHVETLRDRTTAGLGPTLLLLQLAALLVLAVAGANLAGLALTRVADRVRELAVRSALGAGLGRLLRHIAIENLLVALAGGALGLALAFAALRVVEARGLGPETTLLTFAPDATVFAAGFGLAILCGLVASLAPVLWLRRTSLESVLRGDARVAGGGRGAQRLRAGLVVGQLVVSTTLAVLVALLGTSLARLLAVDPGFVADGVLTADLALVDPSAEPRRDLDVAPLVAALRDVPGVTHVGVSNCLPFAGCASMASFRVEGRPPAEGAKEPTAHQGMVDAGLLDALGVDLVAGRGLAAGAKEAVIDETMAQRNFPAASGPGDALGAVLDLGEPGKTDRQYTIVGVARAVKSQSLASAPVEGTFYTLAPTFDSDAQVAVRLPHAAGAAPLLQAVVERALPGYTLRRVEWMTERVRASVGDRLPLLLLVGCFAVLALVLAAIGIYALLALAVARRHAELGVRAALGARPAALMRLVLGQGATLVGLGLALGVAAALAASETVASMLFGVGRAEPLVYVATLAVLGAVALAACWLPARRAAAVDPIRALRHD